MKIESRSRKRSQSERFHSDSVYESVAYDPVKIRLSQSEAEAEESANCKPRVEHCRWFILPLLFATPTMQFSLDRKRRNHKRSQCSASDSVGLIFTKSHCSTLLITTPTTTPSLVKTNLSGKT